jgi:peptidoglycan/LPS O-acetylase OafA/YrhL
MNQITHRLSELDSVRGLAAFVVVLHHCWQTALPDQNVFPILNDGNGGPHSALLMQAAYIISVTPLRLLFSGHAAVGVFFVLSGFVLTKSRQSSRAERYPGFLVRRVCRIWLPFAVVVGVAAWLCAVIAPQPIAGMRWINLSWNSPVDFGLIAGHLGMLGTPEYESLDNPMWSLVHEMRISLIFPLLVVATAASARITALIAMGIFVLFSIHTVVALTGLMDAWLVPGLALSFVQTARYVVFFVFGILLALHDQEIERFLAPRIKLRAVSWVLLTCLLCIPYTKGYYDLAYALGATLLVALCLSSTGVKRVLRLSGLVALGRISYSLYLVHLIIILALVHELHDKVSTYVILAIAIVLSLLVASATYHLLEAPCNQIGKRIARRLSSAPDRPVSKSA